MWWNLQITRLRYLPLHPLTKKSRCGIWDRKWRSPSTLSRAIEAMWWFAFHETTTIFFRQLLIMRYVSNHALSLCNVIGVMSLCIFYFLEVSQAGLSNFSTNFHGIISPKYFTRSPSYYCDFEALMIVSGKATSSSGWETSFEVWHRSKKQQRQLYPLVLPQRSWLHHKWQLRRECGPCLLCSNWQAASGYSSGGSLSTLQLFFSAQRIVVKHSEVLRRACHSVVDIICKYNEIYIRFSKSRIRGSWTVSDVNCLLWFLSQGRGLRNSLYVQSLRGDPFKVSKLLNFAQAVLTASQKLAFSMSSNRSGIYATFSLTSETWLCSKFTSRIYFSG